MSAALAGEQHLKGLEKPQFVDRLSNHYGEWNALHPFREGNGRSLREFFGQLAREAGYKLDQTWIERHKTQWNLVSKQSFHGQLEPLKQVFEQAIGPGRAKHDLAANQAQSHLQAMAKNRVSLDLMERSYPEGHLKQPHIQAARSMLDTLASSIKAHSQELRLSSERYPQHVTQGALAMIRPSIQALERSGFTIQHDVRGQWQAEGIKAEYGRERSK